MRAAGRCRAAVLFLSEGLHRGELNELPAFVGELRIAEEREPALRRQVLRARLLDFSRGTEHDLLPSMTDARLIYVGAREFILGRHSATFTYGMKSLQHAHLVLRALCWALFDKDTLGKRPALLIPPTMKVDGVDRFHIDALPQPARAGFNRYRGPMGVATAPTPWPSSTTTPAF